jgi:hypothetical protein
MFPKHPWFLISRYLFQVNDAQLRRQPQSHIARDVLHECHARSIQERDEARGLAHVGAILFAKGLDH